MQQNNDRQARSNRPRIGRTRFVGLESEQSTTGYLPAIDDLSTGGVSGMTGPQTGVTKKAMQSRPLSGDWNILPEEKGSQSIEHLKQLSGMMRPLRKAGASTTPLPLPIAEVKEEDGYWPLGIQQVGPLPVLNLYSFEPFGRTLPPTVPVVMGNAVAHIENEQQPFWKSVQGLPMFRLSLGLVPG